MEERLRLGISSTDLARGMSKIAGLNYLGDYSHDNMDVGHIMKGLCKQPSSPAAVIINSGNQQSKGEHWEGTLRAASHTRWNLQATRPAEPERLGLQPSACAGHYGHNVKSLWTTLSLLYN